MFYSVHGSTSVSASKNTRLKTINSDLGSFYLFVTQRSGTGSAEEAAETKRRIKVSTWECSHFQCSPIARLETLTFNQRTERGPQRGAPRDGPGL